MTEPIFDSLMLIGRTAAGKSEFIDFLKHVDDKTRSERFHIGVFKEVDDFPWLFTLFQEEDIWEKLGYPRTISKKIEKIYDTVNYDLYKFLNYKFNLEIPKVKKRMIAAGLKKTIIIEFARGNKDGYKAALNQIDASILSNAAIFFLDNTYEESLRRNTVRSSEKDSNQTILYHKTPLTVMEHYYKTHDWYELTDKKPSGYVEAQGLRIPFVTVWNIPETHDPAELEGRYSPALQTLWNLYNNR